MADLRSFDNKINIDQSLPQATFQMIMIGQKLSVFDKSIFVYVRSKFRNLDKRTSSK